MKKSLLSLLLVTFFSLHSLAQNWTFYKDFPVNVTPKDITVNNAGTLFMLTIDNEMYYKTINGQWRKMPLYGGAFNPLCITVDKTSNLLLYGDDQSGLLSSDNFGVTWGQTYFTTGDNTGFHEGISALSNMDDHDIVFGGGIAFVDENNFGSFITKYTPESSEIYFYETLSFGQTEPKSLYYTKNHKLVIGTFNTGIWLTEDDCATILQTNFNEHQITKFTEGINGRVYALGTDLSTNEDFMIYSDDYQNWSPMDLPNNNEKYTTIYFDAITSDLWLGSAHGIYKTPVTPNADATWTSASYNNGDQYLVEIIGDNNGRMYNFSNQYIAQKLSATSTWNNINTGLKGNITDLKFGAENKLIASNHFSSNNVSTALSNTAPWENIYLGGQTTGVTVYSKSDGKIYADTGFNIKKSIDNGVTYTDITPDFINTTDPLNYSYIHKFQLGETGHLFLVPSNEDSKLYQSQDEGSTWSPLFTFPDPIQQIAQDSNGVIYVTLNSFSQSTFHYFDLYYSIDNGVTWETKNIYNYDASSFGRLGSKNNQTIVSLGIKTYLFDYSSPTNNFNLINRPDDFVTQNYSIENLKINNLGDYYVFGNNLYKSTDKGATWINLSRPSNLSSSSVDDVLFDNANTAYILAGQLVPANRRGIYKVTETLGIENPNAEQAITAFPNPAQNTLNIITKEAIKEVSIYDLMGKKIGSFASKNSIDVSQLAKGMYIINVVSHNDQKFSAKFIKE